MKKYLLVKGSCNKCVAAENIRECYQINRGCSENRCYQLNPDWKPASQRVRELAADFCFTGMTKTEVSRKINELANELEQEEKEQ